MQPPTEIDHYRVLGVAPAATDREINRAYKSLMLLYHPDKNEGSDVHASKIHQLQDSREVLDDKTKRALFDLRYAFIKMQWDRYEHWQLHGDQHDHSAQPSTSFPSVPQTQGSTMFRHSRFCLTPPNQYCPECGCLHTESSPPPGGIHSASPQPQVTQTTFRNEESELTDEAQLEAEWKQTYTAKLPMKAPEASQDVKVKEATAPRPQLSRGQKNHVRRQKKTWQRWQRLRDDKESS